MKKDGLMQRMHDFMIEYAYGVTLCAILLMVVGCAMYTQQIKQEQSMQAAANAPEVAATATPGPTMTPVPLATAAPMQLYTTAVKRGIEAVWPVEGGVLRGFDDSTPVMWEALGCVQIHDGLDIAGEAEQAVLCAMDGTVTHTSRDALWGWRVTVAHTDGSSAVYAGLLQIAVSAGQSVRRGQTLGLLMENIPCEGEMPAHLHMELVGGEGNKKDPAGMLPDR